VDVTIDIMALPQEVRDIIELREDTERTFVNFVEKDYTEIFFNTLIERSNPEVEHSMILSCTGMQGSGKSFSAISIAKILNPNFSTETIFFDYNKLVYERAKLKPNSVVLVDEQSQSYGLDSHRVMVILATLKEQLRKKSIHFIFCSPVLYAESQSSMYILEMIFIDYSTQEAYGALKTRDGLVLGHVRIPHPLKDLGNGQSLASQEFIDAYQQHKDEHLERVLGSKDYDIFSDRAAEVMKHPMFKKAEQVYVKKMGYIPQSMLIQIINKIFPEFRSGVGAVEITARIKMEKEIAGKWEIAGRKKGSGKKKNK